MNFDVVIVGAGPSGLSMGIRLAQLAQQQERELSICILEKGSEVGAHILSGAVLEPRGLNELIPDWKEKGAPLNVPLKSDKFQFLTKTRAISLPTPPQMHNKGNYIISLGNFCRWLAEQAEELGVEIFPGFAAAEILYDESGAVRGVATGDMGIGKDGQATENFEPGVELIGRQTIFAEGCRGSLSKQLMDTFGLRDGVEPAWHLYVVRVRDASRRDALFEALSAAGLGVQVHYPPVHLHPIFEDLGYRSGAFPVAEDFSARALSIPLYPSMQDDDVEYVIECVTAAARSVL